MLTNVTGACTKAVKLIIGCTDTNNDTIFELDVERETGLSYLTKPVPNYRLVPKSISEIKPNLIAWDKERMARKFGTIDEWYVKEVVYERFNLPESNYTGKKRGRKPKLPVVQITVKEHLEMKAANPELYPETSLERTERKERMMAKLNVMRGV